MHVKRTRQDRLNAQMARVKKEAQMYVDLLEQKHSREQLQQRIDRKKRKENSDMQQTHIFDGAAAAEFKPNKKEIDVQQKRFKKQENKTQDKPQHQPTYTPNTSVGQDILQLFAA